MVKDRVFQRSLNFNNVFGNCTHPRKEVLKTQCHCPNKQSFVVCSLCYTLFCDPVEACYNARSTEGQGTAGSLSTVVRDAAVDTQAGPKHSAKPDVK